MQDQLSRRERQIMDAVYRLDGGTVAEVRQALEDPPSYSAVRTQLGILEEKGHLTHRQEGRRYVYDPVEPPERAGRRALERLVRTFFDDSPSAAVASLLDAASAGMDERELERLGTLVERARRERHGQKGDG